MLKQLLIYNGSVYDCPHILTDILPNKFFRECQNSLSSNEYLNMTKTFI